MLKNFLPQSNTSIRGNLVWLFRLRNVVIVTQLSLILISFYGLSVDLPIQQMWLIIIAVCVINLYTWMRLKTRETVSELEIFFQIILDVLAFSCLLYLTGGATNPIIWVLLLPVILTAIMLPQSYTWHMVILTCCIYTILIGYNIPLPSIEPHLPDIGLVSIEMQHYLHNMQGEKYFNLHIFGMWVGFIVSAGLIAFFVAELSKTLKERERTLAEARENALRDERAISLGALATSVAHDMGTPLGTMAILTHEIGLEYPKKTFYDLHQKMNVISQQVVRCKEALSVLSASTGEMRAESGRPMTPTKYFDEILNLWRVHDTTTKLNLYIAPASIDAKVHIIADKTLTHAIINILNNASHASPSDKGIDCTVDWDERFLYLKVRDFGLGFSTEIIEFAGKQPIKSNKQGLGVGLFLAYTIINRLGGKIKFINMETRGACVDITLPLLVIG